MLIITIIIIIDMKKTDKLNHQNSDAQHNCLALTGQCPACSWAAVYGYQTACWEPYWHSVLWNIPLDSWCQLSWPWSLLTSCASPHCQSMETEKISTEGKLQLKYQFSMCYQHCSHTKSKMHTTPATRKKIHPIPDTTRSGGTKPRKSDPSVKCPVTGVLK